MQNSGYFGIAAQLRSEAEADALLARGEVQFVVTIPANFTRKLLRGERPALLVEADATDPAATGNAIAALPQISRSALAHDLHGPLAASWPAPAAGRAARAPPLQPRRASPQLQHRARAARRRSSP